MGSTVVLLLSIIGILLVDKDSIFFIKVAPPVPGGALFSGAAERAYLVLGCLIGMAGGPLQAASRSLLVRMAPKDRVAQYFGLFALTGKVTSFVGPLLIGVITAIHRKPEGRHGGAGDVLRRGPGAAVAGQGRIISASRCRPCERRDPYAVLLRSSNEIDSFRHN